MPSNGFKSHYGDTVYTLYHNCASYWLKPITRIDSWIAYVSTFVEETSFPTICEETNVNF